LSLGDAIGRIVGDLPNSGARSAHTISTLADHDLKNGNARTVTGFTADGDIKLDNGWVVPADAGHFRHGFVETSFGSQGRTVQRVILGMSAASIPAMNMEQLYVSASRVKGWIRLYTDDKEEIREAVKRFSQKLAALDPRQKPKPKAETGHGTGLGSIWSGGSGWA
jgi:ATP-dependent exoDNAse (exonuclease V) alpha subunit